MSLSITTSVDQAVTGQPFDVRLIVSDPMSVSTPLTAEAELPNGTKMVETSTVTIIGTYGPVTYPGYIATPDPDDPALFHMTPVTS